MENMNYKLQQQKGAVLLTVLIVLTMMVILVATAASIINNRLSLAFDAKQQLIMKGRVKGKINELVYLAATQRFTIAGLSKGENTSRLAQADGDWQFRTTNDELRVDGFQYKEKLDDNADDALIFSIQANNGLIPINTASTFWLRQWLERYDVDYSQQQKYIDTLHDYIDADTLSRPSGGEDRLGFEDDGLWQPTNYFVQDCSELKLLPHWRTLLKTHKDIVAQCNTERELALNINAVPQKLLEVLWPAHAEQIMQQRAKGEWISSLEQTEFLDNNNIASDELLYRLTTSETLKVMVSHQYFSESVLVILNSGTQIPVETRAIANF